MHTQTVQTYSLYIYSVSQKIPPLEFKKNFLEIKKFKDTLALTHIRRSNLRQITVCQLFLNLMKLYAILCALTQRIFYFHLNAHSTNLIVKYEWSPNLLFNY